MRKTIKVTNITCTSCARAIENHFENTDIRARVNVSSSSVVFEYDENKYDTEYLYSELLSVGYYGIRENSEIKKAKRKDLVDLMIALIFSLPLLYTMFHHLGISFMPMPKILMNGYFQALLATPVLFIAGRRFFIQTYHSIKAKNLGMDSLVVIGTTSAYIYSLYDTIFLSGANLFFETTAVIILMVLIGNYFENRIKEKTSSTLEGLLNLGAKEATKLIDGKEVLVKVEDLKVGDLVIIKGYDKIPIDGIIVSGETYVDESMLTGESMPVVKKTGDKVIGSALNIVETITIRVTEVGSDTVLSKIIQTVEETAMIKPRTQRVADVISGYFVPVVVVLSVLVFIVWTVFLGETISGAFAPAVAVLVVSCPCALGLATPTSISVSSGMAFKEGVLYKSGEFFETANKITAIAFDKTGTLTIGMPVVTDFLGDKESLIYTASLERHSNHPIANAINDYYTGEYLEVTGYETLIGYGIKGIINEDLVYVVSENYLLENNIKNIFDSSKYAEVGKTIFYTVVNNKVLNMVAISDEVKESSYELIKELKRRNITPYMITGDQEKTAKHIADKLGISHVFAGVLPHEKSEIVKRIKETEAFVAFVGDGINDAPALKMADIGFAVGTGSDIALDSSDVNLMKNDLTTVLYAIDLSKATLRNIYLNFFWAFIYNIVMIPLAAFKIFSPTIAGIGMAFSSLAVVLNALSLRLWKFKFRKEG